MKENDEGVLPKRYVELFPSDNSKAAAFDQIAMRYYAGNFGQLSKTDFETLLFHLYIEQILKNDEHSFNVYSDYRLSKELGITQSKVSNLKIRKQLHYPHAFEWRESLASISQNVRYENGKLKLQIPDINLYYEIKNAIEENGGFIDVSLTPKLLQISPEYFLDLLEAVSEEGTRNELRRKLREDLQKNTEDKEYLESEPMGKHLANCTKSVAIWAVKTVAEAAIGSVVGQGSALAIIIGNVIKALAGAEEKAIQN